MHHRGGAITAAAAAALSSCAALLPRRLAIPLLPRSVVRRPVNPVTAELRRPWRSPLPRPLSVAAPPMACAAPAAAPQNPLLPSLDRSAFARDVPLVAVRVPSNLTQKAVVALTPWLYFVPKVRCVVTDPAPDGKGNRLVLLDPGKVSSTDLLELSPSEREHIASLPGVATPYSLRLGYEHMTLEEVLRALLPAAIGQLPSSFETAGHVAHLNLRDELLPYRQLIGQVILDKNPSLRTVVNKTGTINAQFRTFPMEVLAGPDHTHVEVRETGARFKFDFREVYWNSRLSHEHEFMARSGVPAGSVVADMFCGVGPFAVPLAMDPQACTVYANDLNPASYVSLIKNVALNHVAARVTGYNLDARAFITRLVREERRAVGHILMNLPADAIAFTDVFQGLYADPAPLSEAAAAGGSSSSSSSAVAAKSPPSAGPSSAAALASLPLPRIHVYCFSKLADKEASKSADKEAAAEDVVGRLLSTLGLHTSAADSEGAAPRSVQALARERWLPDLEVRIIRDVAPKKLMCCVSFTLPACVAYGQQQAQGSGAAGDDVQPAVEAGGAAAPAGGGSGMDGVAASATSALSEDEPAAKRVRVDWKS